MTRQLLFTLLIIFICSLVIGVIIEIILVATSGSTVPAPKIPRQPQTLGTGKPLTYVVMGDSTSISQGSEYDDGYAVASARHLAKTHTVKFVNTGISGATTQTVREQQLEKAVSNKPDIVLLAVGANDTTHFTRSADIQRDAQIIIDKLKQANSNVQIVVTRSPALDSVSRFPFISKWVMALRTRQVNAAYEKVISDNDLKLAPIAEKTRQAFLDDPTLTAQDNFHPNARGYALWIPVINSAIDEAVGNLS